MRFGSRVRAGDFSFRLGGSAFRDKDLPTPPVSYGIKGTGIRLPQKDQGLPKVQGLAYPRMVKGYLHLYYSRSQKVGTWLEED